MPTIQNILVPFMTLFFWNRINSTSTTATVCLTLLYNNVLPDYFITTLSTATILCLQTIEKSHIFCFKFYVNKSRHDNLTAKISFSHVKLP